MLEGIRFDIQSAQLPHDHFYALTFSLRLTENDLFIYLAVWMSYS